MLDALFWPPIPERAPVLVEEASEGNARYYVLTVISSGSESGATNGAGSGSIDWEIARKIWFDRADLHITRIENFGSGGNTKAKAWRDIWGSGQGIGQIADAPPVAELVDRLKLEFADASRDFTKRISA